MVAIRKIALLREEAFSELGEAGARPVVRAVAMVFDRYCAATRTRFSRVV